MDTKIANRSGPGVEPQANTNGTGTNGQEAEIGEESSHIWVINNQTRATVRSRFYKSLLLSVACVFQTVVAGEVLGLYGPLTFLAFALSVAVCAAVAAREVGALLSAVEMNPGRLKEKLWGSEDEADASEPRFRQGSPDQGSPQRGSSGQKQRSR